MPLIVSILQTPEELQIRKQKCAAHLRPRVKMLQLLAEDGWLSNQELANKTGASLRTVARWIKIYTTAGIDTLLSEARGGDQLSGFTPEDLQQIKERLSDPVNAFTSYKEAVEWINTTFGINKSYPAVNNMLKRRFGTKLKVGRKSHVKKDEAAVAVFKKPGRGD